MCDSVHDQERQGTKSIPVRQAIGTVLAHDITEIRPGEFKGRAFKKGHIIREEDVCHLQRLGKEHLFVLQVDEDEMHENDAAYALANALMGEGVAIKGEPKEGKISIIADRDGLLKINKDALLAFNMLGDVMCSTLHNNTVVKSGQAVAGTRAIPLVVKTSVVAQAVKIATKVRTAECGIQNSGVVEVKKLRTPKAGVVITGNEVYHGRIKDAFAPIITKKIEDCGGEITGIYYAPDDKQYIEDRLRELLNAGADLLITTGGMSVDPDDVTRFAIRNLGVTDFIYGSAVLPGAMFLVAYVSREHGVRGMEQPSSAPSALPSAAVPILGIPACGMYAKTTVFDLVLPRILAGDRLGRKDLAEMGHGGLCMHCEVCRYPVCPFGKG